ncbi:MAG: VCBS repeat-containing protein [Planctomycetales bacterium]|nr:VCBS repeat-containing protein [Planctomycetales bacterium]
MVVDWNEDGLNDLIMLDHEGYLAFFQRRRVRDPGDEQHAAADKLQLLPGKRVFRGQQFNGKHQASNAPDGRLRLNTGSNGGSGRRKLCIVDWDGDGRRDILINSSNVNWLRNVSDDGTSWLFEDQGPLAERILAGHTTSPTTVDWDGDGRRELLVGAEDGRLYVRPRSP